MRITWNSSDSDPRPFTLPPIGNGELSLQIDPEGTMRRDYALFSRPRILLAQKIVPEIGKHEVEADHRRKDEQQSIP